MDYKKFAEKIIALKNADLALRDKLVQSGQLNEGYNEEMKALHNRNAKILTNIIEIIGYPTIDKVGKDMEEIKNKYTIPLEYMQAKYLNMSCIDPKRDGEY